MKQQTHCYKHGTSYRQNLSFCFPIEKNHHGFLIPVERNGVLPDVSARVDHWGPCSLLCTHRAKKGPTPHCLSNNGDVKPLAEAFREVSK